MWVASRMLGYVRRVLCGYKVRRIQPDDRSRLPKLTCSCHMCTSDAGSLPGGSEQGVEQEERRG